MDQKKKKRRKKNASRTKRRLVHTDKYYIICFLQCSHPPSVLATNGENKTKRLGTDTKRIHAYIDTYIHS